MLWSEEMVAVEEWIESRARNGAGWVSLRLRGLGLGIGARPEMEVQMMVVDVDHQLEMAGYRRWSGSEIHPAAALQRLYSLIQTALQI